MKVEATFDLRACLDQGLYGSRLRVYVRRQMVKEHGPLEKFRFRQDYPMVRVTAEKVAP